MEDTIKTEIEINEDVLKALNKYCEREDISINHFIKCNLDLIGEI